MMRFYCSTLALLITVALGQSGVSPFTPGEILEYTAKFNIIPAGTATLEHLGIESVDGQDAIRVQFRAGTGDVADRLFKIRDRIDTWLSVEDLTTLKQEKRLREGSYRKHTRVVVDHKMTRIITLSDTLELQGELRDPYSLLYYLRTIPLQVGDSLAFKTFDNGRFTTFKGLASKSETLKVPAGKFQCIKFRPYRKDKALFKNQGDMIVWFSEDERRIPVQIQIKLKFGSMLLRLTGISYSATP